MPVVGKKNRLTVMSSGPFPRNAPKEICSERILVTQVHYLSKLRISPGKDAGTPDTPKIFARNNTA